MLMDIKKNKAIFFDQHEAMIISLAGSYMFVDYREDLGINSLFSSVSRIVYGSFDYHEMVRLLCVQYLWKNHNKLSFQN